MFRSKSVWTCGKCTDTMCLETGMLVDATFKTARTGGRQSVFRSKSVWTCGKCTDTMCLEIGMFVGATFKTARTGGRQSVFRSRRCGRVANARIRCASKLGRKLVPRSRRHGQVTARACSVQGGVEVWQVHGYDVPRNWDARWCHVQDGTDRWPPERASFKAVWTCGKCTNDVPRDWDARWCHVQDGTDRWPPERVPFKAVWTCGKCTDTMCLEIGMLVGATFKTARTGGRQSVLRSRRCGRVASARTRCASRLGCSLMPRSRRHDRWPQERVPFKAVWTCGKCTDTMCLEIGMLVGATFKTARWPPERVPFKAVWTCGKCTDTMCLETGMLVGATFKTARTGGRQSVFRPRRCGRVASARIRGASKLGCSLVPRSRRHGQVAARACSIQGGVDVWQVHGYDVP